MVTEAKKVVVGIVGAGRMGRGIATAFALAGHAVKLIDLRQRDAEAMEALAHSATSQIGSDADFLARQGLLGAHGLDQVLERVRVVPATEAAAALAGSELIFEAVPETLDAKRGAFAIVGAHASPDAIVASTTSTIDAETLAAMLPDAGQFLNAHWLNPAHLVPLVEVSPAAATRPETIARLRTILESIGKVPIVCKSSPGYIVPRIQALAMNEAARLVEEGVASAEDIDTAVRVGFGLRFSVLGLLEFIDWGGGDILHHASAFLAREVDEARFTAPGTIGRNMAEGRKGLSDGRGFYDYADVDLAAYREGRLADFLSVLRMRGLMPSLTDAEDSAR